jgi:hypothetical protein
MLLLLLLRLSGEVLMHRDQRRYLDQGGTVVGHLIHDMTISFECCILFVLYVHAKLITQVLEVLEADSSQSPPCHDHLILIIIMSNDALNQSLLLIQYMNTSLTQGLLLMLIHAAVSLDHVY